MSGYSAQELQRMRISDLKALETADDIAARMHTITTHGEDRFESRHRRKDGRIVEVEISVQHRSDEGGAAGVNGDKLSGRPNTLFRIVTGAGICDHRK